MSGGTRPGPTGLFATSRHGNFTGSRQTARVLVIRAVQNTSIFWSSSTKLSAASNRIAIDNSARANLHITVRASQPPYSQLYAQFKRAHHALRQHSLIFAMKIARLLSTSTRKAGYMPRPAVAQRDVAAEAIDRVQTTPSSLVARENAAGIRIRTRGRAAAAREGRDDCAPLRAPRNRRDAAATPQTPSTPHRSPRSKRNGRSPAGKASNDPILLKM